MNQLLLICVLMLINNKVQAVDVDATCFCEHFATPFDQFCEASPQSAPASAHYIYRYIWSSTDPSVIIDPVVSTGPTTVATCANGSGCEVKLSVRVEAIDSFYFPFQVFVYGSDTSSCASGTPNPGGLL